MFGELSRVTWRRRIPLVPHSVAELEPRPLHDRVPCALTISFRPSGPNASQGAYLMASLARASGKLNAG